MKLNGIRAVAAVYLAVISGHAQEFDPHDPSVIALGLERASVVVTGKFTVDWCLPWFDRWHCKGAIHVEESLYGELKPHAVIPFRWKEAYGTTCFPCEKLSIFDDHSGIWLLARKKGALQFSGTMADWCGGPLPMECRDTVVRCIRQRGAK